MSTFDVVNTFIKFHSFNTASEFLQRRTPTCGGRQLLAQNHGFLTGVGWRNFMHVYQNVLFDTPPSKRTLLVGYFALILCVTFLFLTSHLYHLFLFSWVCVKILTVRRGQTCILIICQVCCRVGVTQLMFTDRVLKIKKAFYICYKKEKIKRSLI